MKKTALILAALMGMATMSQAQYYMRTEPFLGDFLLGLKVGGIYAGAPHFEATEATGYRLGLPLTAAFSFDGEDRMGDHFALGFQAELSYSTIGSKFTLDGDQTDVPAPGQYIHYNTTRTMAGADMRLSLTYYVNDMLSVSLGGGINETLLNSTTGTTTHEAKLTGVSGPESDKQSFTSGGINFSTQLSVSLAVHYYLNDNVFTSVDLRYRHPFSPADWTTKDNYSLMVGIGYKILRDI